MSPSGAPVREVLGIEVTHEQLLQWRAWTMPVDQPFVVPRSVAHDLGLRDEPERVTFELKDTFLLYGVDDRAICWLDRAAERALPASLRRAQPTRHLWRSGDDASAIARDLERVVAYVVEGRRASRHREITERAWADIDAVLPGAREIAGTFSRASGPNCFGAVLAAAGVEGAREEWMQREPIEAWLRERTRLLPRHDTDDGLGVVHVWRNPEGLIDHAAVSLGGGYALHKPSCGWMSPTKVLTTRELMASARVPGRRVRRHRLL